MENRRFLHSEGDYVKNSAMEVLLVCDSKEIEGMDDLFML